VVIDANFNSARCDPTHAESLHQQFDHFIVTAMTVTWLT